MRHSLTRNKAKQSKNTALRGLCFAVCIQVLAGNAIANSFRIQTGEHATFTRVALVFDTDVDWTAGTLPGGFGVRIEGSDRTTTLDNVFQLIPRDRIQDIVWRESEQTLFIQSDCECSINPFEDQPGVVVIDVHTGMAPERAEYNDPLPRQRRDAVAAEWNFIPLTILQTLPSEPVPFGIFLTERSSNDANIGQAILNDVLLAAEAGILAHSSETAHTEEITTIRTEDTPLAEQSIEILKHIALRRPEDNQESQLANSTQSYCPDPTMGTVGSWGSDPLSTSPDITLYSSGAILDEHGKLNESEVLSHTKKLLFLGFGAEARAHLDLLPFRDSTSDLLREVSWVLDDKVADQANRLAAATSCSSEWALWAIAAQPVGFDQTNFKPESLVKYFQNLPIHLLEIIGPKFVRNLRVEVSEETAYPFFSILERSLGSNHPRIVALRLIFSTKSIDAAQDEAQMASLISRGKETAPDALLSLLASRNGHDELISDDYILLAESFIHELQDSPIATSLTVEIIKSLARASRFSEAANYLEGIRLEKSSMAHDAADFFFRELAHLASDSTFLVQTHSLDIFSFAPTLSSASLRPTADRFLDLDFVAEAARIIELIPPEDDQGKLLRARLHLRKNLPSQALEDLDTLSSQEARLLRAEALQMLNRASASATSFQDLGETDLARSVAWDSQEDDLIRTFGSDPERTLIETLQGDGERATPPEQLEVALDDLSFQNLENVLSNASDFRAVAREVLSVQGVVNQ